jgi:hypothetical protein
VLGKPPDDGLYRGKGGVVFTLNEAQKREFAEAVNDLRASLGLTNLNAQVLGGALCEFDKYERIRLCQGKVRRYKHAKAVSATGGR